MRSRHRSAVLFLGAALALIFVISPARGDIVTYPDLASYTAATTGNTTIDFTSIAPTDGYKELTVPAGITLGGVNFTINQADSNGRLFVVDAGFDMNFFHVTLLDSQYSSSTNENIVITLPFAVTAAAINFGSNINSVVTFELSTGELFTRSTIAQEIQFVGLTSTTPFTTITISQPIGGALAIQDFTYGTAVPEPSSLTLLATSGIGLLGYGLRRRYTARKASV